MKRAIKSALSRLGFEVARRKPNKFEALASVCTATGVEQVYDVGANSGQFALGLRHAGFRGRIVSFEPLPEAFATLDALAGTDPAWVTRRIALGDMDGDFLIRVAGAKGAASSFMRLTPLAGRITNLESEREITVAMHRLDDEVAADTAFAGKPAMLKLDVQGFERNVLDGGRQSLGKFSLLLLEASLFRLYDGELLFAELIELAGGFGLRPVAIFNEFTSPLGVTLQADILFANTDALAKIEAALGNPGPPRVAGKR